MEYNTAVKVNKPQRHTAAGTHCRHSVHRRRQTQTSARHCVHLPAVQRQSSLGCAGGQAGPGSFASWRRVSPGRGGRSLPVVGCVLIWVLWEAGVRTCTDVLHPTRKSRVLCCTEVIPKQQIREDAYLVGKSASGPKHCNCDPFV